MQPITTDYASIIARRLDKHDWQTIFELGNTITNKHFKNWQLGFGTLLGAVREEQQYINHDIDLDIDILLDNEEHKIIEFQKMMEQNKFKLIRRQEFEYDGENLVMSLAFKHQKIDVIYDVCFFRQWGTDYLHLGKSGLVIRPEYSEERIRFEVLDMPCYIPKEYEKYLTGRYGNWQVPKSEKDDWETDAKEGTLFIKWKFNK